MLLQADFAKLVSYCAVKSIQQMLLLADFAKLVSYCRINSTNATAGGFCKIGDLL